MSEDELIGLLPLALVLALGLAFFLKWRKRERQPTLVTAETPLYKGPLAFFRRHFNGDYSLGRSYWVNTFLLSIMAPGLGIVLVPFLANRFPARYASAAFLLVMAFAIVLWVWAIAGTWASANKHVARGGRAFWAGAAKVMIVLGVISNLGELSRQAPAFNEHFRVAFGEQPGPETKLQVQAGGRTILLSGGINDGTAEQLSATLAIAPSVTTIVLQSRGGWIRQGLLVADVIRAHQLNTYAEGVCASACTIAFLAGKERTVAPRAKLGFHSPRSVGGEEISSAESARLSAIYRSARLPEPMIQRIADTSFESIWFPTHEELLAAGVITRQSLGGEGAALATGVRSRESLVAELKKVEAFAALSERFPDEFERLLDVAWEQMHQGASDAEVVTATRRQLTSIAPRLVPLGPDSTLLAYLDLAIQQLQALHERNREACVELAFPSGRPIDLSMFIPQDLRQRELDLLVLLIRQADPALKPRPDSKRSERLMAQVVSSMTDAQIEAIDRLQQGIVQDPALDCDASIALFRGINALAPKDRTWLMRTLYAAGT